jgi:hypothetical protein
VTRLPVASNACARSPPASPLRRLQRSRSRPLRRLPRRSPASRSGPLRLLRRTDGLARRPLPRVRRPPARVLVGARGRRLRGRHPTPRLGVEGARPARPRAPRGRGGRRAGRATRRRRADVRPAGRRPEAGPRLPPRRAARGRARPGLVASRSPAPRAGRRLAPPARPLARRAAAERPRRLCRSRASGRTDRPRRRRLHERRHRGRCEHRPPLGRGGRCGGRDVRAHDSDLRIRVRAEAIVPTQEAPSCSSTSRARTSR